jgi:hypothetical protein
MGTPLLHVSANVQNLSNVLLPSRVDPAAWRFERQQWVASGHPAADSSSTLASLIVANIKAKYRSHDVLDHLTIPPCITGLSESILFLCLFCTTVSAALAANSKFCCQWLSLESRLYPNRG